MHLTCLVGDARRMLDFATGSFHLIHSNNTFEHIYPEILSEILTEFERLISPVGGIQSHFIDLSDHFAHLDRSISIYNFLRFSEREWAFIDNSIQPQNRLRWPQYLEMYERLGICTVDEDVRPGDLKALEKVPRTSVFAKISAQNTAISHGYLISKRS